MDDHQFKKKENESVGEMSKVWSQTVLKCLCLARVGRPDCLWYVNKLARAVTKWMKAWPGGWGPKSMSLTCGGGSARVPNVPVCRHLWHTQEEKGEITSCRGIFQSAWQKLSVRRKEEEPGCPQGKVVAVWYGDDSLHLSLLEPAVFPWQ